MLNFVYCLLLKCTLRQQQFVHKGFWNAYNVIRDELVSKVRSVLKEGSGQRKIYITGHSLGGALAIHAGRHLSLIFKQSIRIYTYGAPRVGNGDFASSLTQNVSEVNLFVNNCDPAPFVPPLGPNVGAPNRHYKHPQGIKYINKKGEIKTKLPTAKLAINCNHHRIQSYIDAITKVYDL